MADFNLGMTCSSSGVGWRRVPAALRDAASGTAEALEGQREWEGLGSLRWKKGVDVSKVVPEPAQRTSPSHGQTVRRASPGTVTLGPLLPSMPQAGLVPEHI